MRQIKFRGKCVADSKYAGQWVYGGYSEPQEDCKQNEGLITVYLGGSSTCKYHVIPNTVGQFTGLCDINGKEIYEGDIIKSSHGTIHYIVYDNDLACFKAVVARYNPLGEYSTLSKGWVVQFNKEVIGNIHDNPELLQSNRYDK